MSGEWVGALAMTEPSAGSDFANIKTCVRACARACVCACVCACVRVRASCSALFVCFAFDSRMDSLLHNAIIHGCLGWDGGGGWVAGWLDGDGVGVGVGVGGGGGGGGGGAGLGARYAKQDGTDWIINGSKVFITNGWHSDVVIVCAKTATDKGAHGITLFVVEQAR